METPRGLDAECTSFYYLLVSRLQRGASGVNTGCGSHLAELSNGTLFPVRWLYTFSFKYQTVHEATSFTVH